MQTGELVRYELLLGYRETLIYAHDLGLWQVMDLLIEHYCGINTEGFARRTHTKPEL